MSLSDESSIQHDDSSDQDLDEEHRIGGLGIDSGIVFEYMVSSHSGMHQGTWL